jgi:hypothetical protein
MTKIRNILIQKLCSKGLTSAETTRIIRDVVHIVRGNSGFTQTTVNRKLEVLGWQTHILDPATLDLIVCVSENNPASGYPHRHKRLLNFAENAERLE